jgi:hypothetical protein
MAILAMLSCTGKMPVAHPLVAWPYLLGSAARDVDNRFSHAYVT